MCKLWGVRGGYFLVVYVATAGCRYKSGEEFYLFRMRWVPTPFLDERLLLPLPLSKGSETFWNTPQAICFKRKTSCPIQPAIFKRWVVEVSFENDPGVADLGPRFKCVFCIWSFCLFIKCQIVSIKRVEYKCRWQIGKLSSLQNAIQIGKPAFLFNSN